MTLTDKQAKGLKLAVSRYKNKEPFTVIAGFAGSGKSTLVQFIIKELNIPESKIAYVAYTGKAALVLKNKGCPGATTAHKLLYHTLGVATLAYYDSRRLTIRVEKNSRFPYGSCLASEKYAFPCAKISSG